MDTPFSSATKSRLSTLGEILAEWFEEHNHLGLLQVLARTCKSFTEPMLMALWETLPNIGILFFSLPEGAWEVKPVKRRDGIVVHRLVSVYGSHSLTQCNSGVAPSATTDHGGCNTDEILCLPRRGRRPLLGGALPESPGIHSRRRLHLLAVASLQYHGGSAHPSPTGNNFFVSFIFNPSGLVGAPLSIRPAQSSSNLGSFLLYPKPDHPGYRRIPHDAPRTPRSGKKL